MQECGIATCLREKVGVVGCGVGAAAERMEEIGEASGNPRSVGSPRLVVGVYLTGGLVSSYYIVPGIGDISAGVGTLVSIDHHSISLDLLYKLAPLPRGTHNCGMVALATSFAVPPLAAIGACCCPRCC